MPHQILDEVHVFATETDSVTFPVFLVHHLWEHGFVLNFQGHLIGTQALCFLPPSLDFKSDCSYFTVRVEK